MRILPCLKDQSLIVSERIRKPLVEAYPVAWQDRILLHVGIVEALSFSEAKADVLDYSWCFRWPAIVDLLYV